MTPKVLESFFGKISAIHFIVVCLLTGLAILFIYQKSYTVSLSRKVSSLEGEITKLSALNMGKRLIIANLCSNDVLYQKATQFCDMHSCSSHCVEIIVLKDQVLEGNTAENAKSNFNIVKTFFSKWNKWVYWRQI